MPVPRRRPLALLLFAALALAACSHRPPRGDERGNAPGALPTEKAVLRALGEVDASEPQRLAVLAAFDRDEPERRRTEEETAALHREIGLLDHQQADYPDRLQPLAARQGQLLTDQLMLRARFDQAVSAALSPEQYEHWQAALLPRADGPGGRGGGGGRGRGPRGGGLGGP